MSIWSGLRQGNFLLRFQMQVASSPSLNSTYEPTNPSFPTSLYYSTYVLHTREAEKPKTNQNDFLRVFSPPLFSHSNSLLIQLFHSDTAHIMYYVWESEAWRKIKVETRNMQLRRKWDDEKHSRFSSPFVSTRTRDKSEEWSSVISPLLSPLCVEDKRLHLNTSLQSLTRHETTKGKTIKTSTQTMKAQYYQSVHYSSNLKQLNEVNHGN